MCLLLAVTMGRTFSTEESVDRISLRLIGTRKLQPNQSEDLLQQSSRLQWLAFSFALQQVVEGIIASRARSRLDPNFCFCCYGHLGDDESMYYVDYPVNLACLYRESVKLGPMTQTQ